MSATFEKLDWGVFHDGDIVSIRASGECLLFQVEIDYLARRMIPKISFFTVRTDKVKWVKYESYTGESESDPAKVEKLRPEILSSRIEGDIRILECSEGILSIEYSSEVILDENGNSIAAEALYDVARSYWDRFGNPESQ